MYAQNSNRLYKIQRNKLVEHQQGEEMKEQEDSTWELRDINYYIQKKKKKTQLRYTAQTGK